MNKTVEIRHTPGTVELRAAGDGQVKLGGYALKFEKWSQDLGGFVERVAPGAVTKTLKDGADVLARYQHRDEFLLGRTSSGTLTLRVDKVGLDYEVTLPDTQYARDLAALAERGDVAHSSFAFRTVSDSWHNPEKGGQPLERTLTEIKLVDVAPVVNPAYLDTSTGLRSIAELRHLSLDEIEAAAREGRLDEILGLRSEDETEDDATEPPGNPHGDGAMRRRRAALDLLRKNHH